jgi:hypothetical protein
MCDGNRAQRGNSPAKFGSTHHGPSKINEMSRLSQSFWRSDELIWNYVPNMEFFRRLWRQPAENFGHVTVKLGGRRNHIFVRCVTRHGAWRIDWNGTICLHIDGGDRHQQGEILVSHRHLKEHVDQIARARLGSKFPTQGVGKNWTARFMLRLSDRIKMVDHAHLKTSVDVQ